MERWQFARLASRRPQMRNTFVAITALALVPLGAAGCVSKSEYTKAMQSAEVRHNAVEAQNTRLTSDLADAGKRNEQLTAERTQLERTLTMKSGELGQRVSTLEGDNSRLKQELAEAQKAREEKVREVSSTYEQLVAKMKGEIDKGQVTISELKGKLTVNLVDAILFDSGKSEIKPEGLVVLGKVIEILKTVSDKSIRIEGHTDNQPIVGPLTQRYQTNWELSASRAINVARYLQKQAIEPANLSAAAFGEFKPVADNATQEGRAKNRRIEIVLVPKE
jgi:chemotaxis protein MotB